MHLSRLLQAYQQLTCGKYILRFLKSPQNNAEFTGETSYYYMYSFGTSVIQYTHTHTAAVLSTAMMIRFKIRLLKVFQECRLFYNNNKKHMWYKL
jgi:hypothetical protein